MSDRSDIVDIAGEKRAETEKAIQWFDGKTLAMPEWLAKDKGFI